MNAHLTNPAERFQQLMDKIQAFANKGVSVANAGELRRFEQHVARLTLELEAAMVAMKLQEMIDSEVVQRQATQRIKGSAKKLRNQGRRPFTIRLRCKMTIQVWAAYWSRSSSSRTNAKHGLYPELAVLGLICHHTPAAVEQISKLVSLASSMQEAKELLSDHGYDLSVNCIRRLVYRVSALVRAAQSQGTAKISGDVTGRTIVVSVDGGRVRIRANLKRRTKKKRNCYSANWREPKLLIIYVADAKGRIDRSFPPVIDGTLAGPDQAFAQLRMYLQQLQADKAARVLFVADGAQWIWRRVKSLFASVKIAADRCHMLVDFYHAYEYLGKIAESKRQWKPSQRKQWLKTQRKRLLRGEVGSICEEITQVIGSRPTKDQKRWLNYFKRNALNNRRMDYAAATANNLPIGSGAMESAIRRIVNLRLKGPSIFWHEENAEAILLQRAWHKSGRTQDLMQHAFEGAFAFAL